MTAAPLECRLAGDGSHLLQRQREIAPPAHAEELISRNLKATGLRAVPFCMTTPVELAEPFVRGELWELLARFQSSTESGAG